MSVQPKGKYITSCFQANGIVLAFGTVSKFFRTTFPVSSVFPDILSFFVLLPVAINTLKDFGTVPGQKSGSYFFTI